MKVNLSAVIITYNEERNIKRCLDSLEGVVDEIVVVDSFSTDRTKTICLQAGATFIEHVFEGHIEQKNWAAQQATNDFVLSLDADEALDETLKKEILRVKSNWIADGYSFNRLTNYCGKWVKHCGWYPDVKLRLWDRKKGAWGGTNPHDLYKMEAGCTIQHLKGDLLHYSYYTIQEHIAQTNYFTDISAKAYFKKGIRSSWFKILVKPLFSFFSMYVLKRGFLDGYYGWVISRISANATFLKYIKLKELQK